MSPVELLILALLLLVIAVVFIAVIVSRAGGHGPAHGNPNLRPCPDCGNLVSLRAPTCPHCGRPLDPLQ